MTFLQALSNWSKVKKASFPNDAHISFSDKTGRIHFFKCVPSLSQNDMNDEDWEEFVEPEIERE